MFTASLGQHLNLLPGIQNFAVAGRNPGRTSRAAASGGSLASETAKRLHSLSSAEKEVLANKSSKILEGLLGTEARIHVKDINWEAVLSQAVDALQSGRVNITNTGRGSRSLLNQQALLASHSPLLNTARGFKTKASSTSVKKPFTQSKSKEESGGQDDEFQLVLKQLSISPAEKEKVRVALATSVAVGAGKNNTENEADSKANWKSKMNAAWMWDKAHKLSLILIIIVCTFGVAQIFGYNIRVQRTLNEISPEDIEVSFDDVKGCDEAKQELQEVVEFLMNPDKFGALGGKLPKGCLLVGPPGTGKTLLAKAVAGEANVPFFQASGSEFDEVLVGQGAKRVRDLFRTAKDRAPCVVFIDEIDSVGGKRTNSSLHPYANQTINQLLSEMDGFTSSEGVIVLGATNRADDLDKALLRPGRFDSQVTVGRPDVKGRTEILELYLGKVKHDETLEVESIARRTSGWCGADLFNLVNTAALRAAVDEREAVGKAELDYAFDKIAMGADLKSRTRPKEDLKITAYHEAGHTLVSYYSAEVPHTLHKVTIIAKGGSGGHTAFVPKEGTEWHETKAQMKAQMDTAMGGRVAEELIFGKEKVTGGASSDLQGAYSIAEKMVKSLGMSEKVGLRAYNNNDAYNFQVAPATKEMIDEEIKRLLDESYKRATNVLSAHMKELHLLAEALLKYETLDVDDIRAIIEYKKPPPSKLPPASPTLLGLKQTGLAVGLVGAQTIEPRIGTRTDGAISS